MSPLPRRVNAPVELDAQALRAFIRSHSVDVGQLAASLLCDRSYLSKLQTGAAPRCSSAFFSRLCHLLGVEDPRELMRQPEHYVPDAAVSTAAIPRVGLDAARPPSEATPELPTAEVPVQRPGRHRRETASAR